MSAPRPESAEEVIARLRARLDPLDRTWRADAGLAPARSDYDLVLDGESLRRTPLAPAAVLAPLVERDGALWLVFTERASHLKRHPGQISLPGGRIDPDDPDPATAALREAREEIALDPGQVELLGTFDPYETVTGYAIIPFVGLVRGAFEPIPDPREVAAVFEAPLAFFMDPANHSRSFLEVGGARRDFYEMPYGARYIWGATAGLLKALYDRLYREES